MWFFLLLSVIQKEINSLACFLGRLGSMGLYGAVWNYIIGSVGLGSVGSVEEGFMVSVTTV